MVAYFTEIDAQELIGSGSHVDVERLALGTLSVKKLVDGLIGRRLLQKDGRNVKQRLAQIG